MPIHLPPLSRRAFLRRALVAGVAVGCAPRLLAAERPANPNSWILLADTHIAADATKVNKAVNMTRHLAAVSEQVLQLSERPAGAFVVGDCAFSQGAPGDYTQFAKLIEPLRTEGVPVHLLLGNHDHRENFWAGLASEKNVKRPVADKQAALIRTEFVNWFLLDSLEKTQQTPGALGGPQLKWLSETLDANASKPAVIVVHHNPGIEENLGLKDTLVLWQVLRPRQQVKAWVYGHTHNWKISQDDSGIHLVNLPPTSYVFRNGDPAGWLHATTRRDGMRLELHSLDPQNKSHGQVVDLKWREA
ncbi:MAG TPA: metallophosphoesterase [Verrucomicrobiae bacterium]|nr:metallophosphoesterase [Verrucomicrobiae bacterium]